MKLSHLTIRNFLGLEQFEADIPDAGAVVTGGNARGKSSILKAIKAALQAQGVSQDAIRLGADKAEILIDLDALKVRRSITASGSAVQVATKDGDKWAKPQTRLNDLLGATLDPLAFYLATPAERRSLILAACPVHVTAEDFQRWTGDDWTPTEGKHGLDVVDEVRQSYYDARKRANAESKEAGRMAEEARVKAAALVEADKLPKGVTVPLAGQEDAPVRAAESEVQGLRRRQADAEAMATRTAGTRERIAKLRAEEAAALAGAPEIPLGEWTAARDALAAQKAEVERIEKLLADAEKALVPLQTAVDDLTKRQERYEVAGTRGARLHDQARDLEETLAETSIAAPTADELSAAEAAVISAKAHADLVRAARAARDALVDAAQLADEAEAAKAEADRLDRIVTTLSTTAPVELAARSKTIPGLAFVGGTITLDGRVLDNLSGAEQMDFAVDLAKRVNKSKLLVVDELEKLDEDRRRQFFEKCTADGYQLIGAMVTKGELKLVAVESTRAPADAEKA